MSKFKVGDKVVEISTSDVGVITSKCDYDKTAWWITWDDFEDVMWVSEKDISHYNVHIAELTQQDLQFLETVLKEHLNRTRASYEHYKFLASDAWEYCDKSLNRDTNFKLFSRYNTKRKAAAKKLKKLAELQAKVKRMKG